MNQDSRKGQKKPGSFRGKPADRREHRSDAAGKPSYGAPRARAEGKPHFQDGEHRPTRQGRDFENRRPNEPHGPARPRREEPPRPAEPPRPRPPRPMEPPRPPRPRPAEPPRPPRPPRPPMEPPRPGEPPRPPRPDWDERGPRFATRRPVENHRARSARDVALSAIGDVVRGQAYASHALDRSLTGANLSEEDRRLAASLFYFTVENHIYIEWALSHLMEDKPEPVVLDILHLAAAQILFMDKIPDHAAVNEAVEQVRNAGRPGLDKLVNGVLRSLIRARDGGELILPDRETEPLDYLSIRYSLAKPAVERLVAAYGVEETESILSSQAKNRTETVRPNLMRISRADFEDLLSREGFSWTHGAVQDSYILTGAGSLSEHPAYRAGLFSIQGESSMLAAQAVEARPGMQILDACAAPGGKTCLMAEAMGGAGRVFAWDVHAHRVELVRAAARRLGLENVRPTVHDARRPIESMEMSMDAVLVDAPCSGLGVMSDKPDVKFRVTEEGMNSLAALQKEILESCASMVKVGGRLVYSTCTILPEENCEQVKAFLERHSEFALDISERWLPESLKGRMEQGMLQLLPDRDGVEGFFIARMIRRSL